MGSKLLNHFKRISDARPGESVEAIDVETAYRPCTGFSAQAVKLGSSK
jgi:hypothetical protein